MKIILQHWLLLLFLFIMPKNLLAGPPYGTDDPEPVPFKNWELYISSLSSYSSFSSQGTLPHFEANYGVVYDMQLHLILPMAFNNEHGNVKNYGFGDIEIGVKYRFIHETKYIPQVGIFPLCEMPTGNQSKGLGNGSAQFFLPIWLQKSFGDKWQTYGGYGYWINPGAGNKNWNYIGWQLQYQIHKNISIGVEVYHETASTKNGQSDSRFNFGSIIDLNDNNHILLSAGRSFNGSTVFQMYVGYLFTISKSKVKTSSFNMKNRVFGRGNIDG
jgi:hypothetical protein